MIGFHQISLSTFIRNFALCCNVHKFEKFEQFLKFSKQTFRKQQCYYQQYKYYVKTEMKFLRRFVQEISSPQTNKLTNEHSDTMLILCFLDSPDHKTGKSAKNRQSKICNITKVPHAQYEWELKLKEDTIKCEKILRLSITVL